MTDQALDLRFERDLRAVLASSEPADVPASLYAFVDAIPRPAPGVVAPPARRGWDPRALAVLAAAAVLAIVAVGIGSGIVRLPGIVPQVGTPTVAPNTQTYRLYYEVMPLDRHTPTTDELQGALDVLRARAAAYQRTATGEVLTDIPHTVAVDVALPADDPGRLEELRAVLPLTGGVLIGTMSDGPIEVGASTTERAFEPAYGSGVAFTPTLRADKSALDLAVEAGVYRPFSDWASFHPGETGVITTSDGVVLALAPITVPVQGGSWTIPFTANQVAAGVPRRMLALFASGPLRNPVREVAPAGLPLAPGISPEPDPTPAPTVAPGNSLYVEYVVLPTDGTKPTTEDIFQIEDLLSGRLSASGVTGFRIGTTTEGDRITVDVPVPADDPSVTGPLRKLLGATGLVEFVPLGNIGLEGGLIDPASPRLFAGNLDPVGDAAVVYDQDGNRMVQLTLEPSAAAEFESWSAAHSGELFALVVDGNVISVPTIMSAIPDGVLQVSWGAEGGWPEAEATNLVALLASGRLPHPISEISTNAAEAARTPAPSAAPAALDVAGFVAACPAVGGCSYALELRGADAQWRADLAVDAAGQVSAGAGLPATLEPGYSTVTATSRRNLDSIGGGIGDPGPVDATCSADFAVAAGDDVMLVSATFAKGSCENQGGRPAPVARPVRPRRRAPGAPRGR